MPEEINGYPEEWDEERKDNLNDNNVFKTWFNESFEVGANFECSKKEAEELFNASNCKDMKLKDELVRLKLGIEYKAEKRIYYNKKQVRGVYVGFKSNLFVSES